MLRFYNDELYKWSPKFSFDVISANFHFNVITANFGRLDLKICSSDPPTPI